MNLFKLALLVVGLSLTLLTQARPALAASFDCTKASTKTERMVCAEPSLSAKDAALAKLYAAALRGPKAAEVRAAQRRWVEQVQKRCADAACLGEAYDSRLSELFADGAKAAQAYERTDRNGTLMLVAAEGDWVAFDASAIWKGAGDGDVNTGEVAGVARATGNQMTYKGEDCDLTFVRTSPTTWRVATARDCGLGLNVTLNGAYQAGGK